MKSVDNKRPLKVFLCHAHADRDAVRGLYTRLTKDGVDAWLDKEKLLPGQDWEMEIRKAVREADVVVVCLSKQFNQAGFRQKEVRLALDTANEKPEGEIFIIPARLEECDTLESLRKWHWVDLFEEDGYDRLMRAFRVHTDEIAVTHRKKDLLSEKKLGDKTVRELGEELPVGHPASQNDRFYIIREVDHKLTQEIDAADVSILLSGVRQTGKSTLLFRELARVKSVANIAYVDFQSVAQDEFGSPERFFGYFASAVTRKLKLDEDVVNRVWQVRLNPQLKLTKIFEDHLLPNNNRRVVLAIDGADRLLGTSFSNDFFSLLRSWYNSRDTQWRKLGLILVFSTEPFLLVSDISQTPFNVGINLEVEDFNREQVKDLSLRYGLQISSYDLDAFFELLSGHPYLTRRALDLLAYGGLTWKNLYKNASDDYGPFADHLRSQFLSIKDNLLLRNTFQKIVYENKFDEDSISWQIARSGLIKHGGDRFSFRCGLYEKYFKRI